MKHRRGDSKCQWNTCVATRTKCLRNIRAATQTKCPWNTVTQTKPKDLVLMARASLVRSVALLEYRGMYRREMQVLAVGRCSSSAGRMVMLGMGWNPSSLAGSAGLDVQKYTWKTQVSSGIYCTEWMTKTSKNNLKYRYTLQYRRHKLDIPKPPGKHRQAPESTAQSGWPRPPKST